MMFRTKLASLTLATVMVVPMFADDRDWGRDRRDDRRDRREDREDRIREMRRREASRNNGRYGNGNGNYGYGNGNYGYGNGNSGYGVNSGYGGGYGQSNAVINRALQNLQTAASRNRVDSHERSHFSRAINELQNMRNNNIDSRRLGNVLEDLDDLSRADQINPRDRQMLARDRQALASLYGGYGSNRW